MYELIQAVGRSHYFQCPAKIGLVRLEGADVCLIDAGSDKDAGRKVRQQLDANGWRLAAIYATHSHADHIGGAKYLQGQTGCPVYAPGIERDFTCHTVLEPAGLYGGYPFRELRHKFLMAQPCEARPLAPQDLPAGMEAIPLPGHSFDMTGYRTADGVVYLADCLSSAETLAKYKIGYLWDAAAYLDTLERVKTMDAALFVPAHAPAAEDIAPLAQSNIDAVYAVADAIEELCAEPMAFDGLLRALFNRYALTMTFEQHALVGSTVRSYLAWMKDAGRLTAFFEDNTLLWRRA